MNRKGAWGNFDVHHMLGVGVRADANARTSDLFSHIDSRLVELAAQFRQLADIREFLATLREEVKEWKQEYLRHANDIGRTAFTPYLDDATDLWQKCRQRWGGGPGYRNDIADLIREWFENTPELDAARKRVESALQQSWRDLVLKPLVETTQIESMAEES